MNTAYNDYNYGEHNELYTWLDETRDWRNHEHKHLEESTEKIMKNVDETREQVLNRVDVAERNLDAKLTTINTYVVNIDKQVDTIDANVKDIKDNMVNRIVNSIKQYLRVN